MRWRFIVGEKEVGNPKNYPQTRIFRVWGRITSQQCRDPWILMDLFIFQRLKGELRPTIGSSTPNLNMR